MWAGRDVKWLAVISRGSSPRRRCFLAVVAVVVTVYDVYIRRRFKTEPYTRALTTRPRIPFSGEQPAANARLNSRANELASVS